MSWEKFDVICSGICKLMDDRTGAIVLGEYEMGRIVTGKQRVYHCDQIMVRVGWKSIIGRTRGDCGSYLPALASCNEQLKDINLSLLVAGNEKSYSESGMSGGSGHGYLGDGREFKCYKIMDEYIPENLILRRLPGAKISVTLDKNRT